MDPIALFDAAEIFGSLVANLQATILALIPVVLPILGIMTAFRAGKKLWNKFTA